MCSSRCLLCSACQNRKCSLSSFLNTDFPSTTAPVMTYVPGVVVRSGVVVGSSVVVGIGETKAAGKRADLRQNISTSSPKPPYPTPAPLTPPPPASPPLPPSRLFAWPYQSIARPRICVSPGVPTRPPCRSRKLQKIGNVRMACLQCFRVPVQVAEVREGGSLGGYQPHFPRKGVKGVTAALPSPCVPA